MRPQHQREPRLSFLAAAALLAALTLQADGCSNFIMGGPSSGGFAISGRTMDLGPGLKFGIRTFAAGSVLAGGKRRSKYGFVGFVPEELGVVLPHFVSAGLNEAGLSCDEQTLLGTVYPNRTGTSSDLTVDSFCEWVLGTCADTTELEKLLSAGNVTVHGPSIAGGQHFVARDAAGRSTVVEFLEGETVVATDLNDGGTTGYGVMTNEPPFAWQVENVRHASWKQKNARPAFTIPGTFYPDERFLRLHLLKSAMPRPESLQQAILQAVHVLNSVTVPMGDQMGTDSSAGEGAGDHTMWGVIYDHGNRTIYWRTQTNHNLARLRLSDAGIASGQKPATLPFDRGILPWYVDAASYLERA